MVDVAGLQARARTAPREVRLSCERLLADQALSPTERAGLLVALGWAAFTQADTVAAADALAEASQYSSQGEGIVDPAELMRLESAVLIEQGQTGLVESRLEVLLEEAAETNRSRLWSALGAARSAGGEHERAIDSYNKGLEEARAFGDRASELILLNNRAVAWLELGRSDEVAHDVARVRAEHNRENFPHVYATSTHNLGVNEARKGRLAEANGYFSEASQMLIDFGDLVSHSHALLDQSHLFLDAGLLDEAQDSASRSLRTFNQLDASRRCAEALVVQARALVGQGEWRAASQMANAALERLPASMASRAETQARHIVFSCNLVDGSSSESVDREMIQQTARSEPDLAVDAAIALLSQRRSDEAQELLRPLVAEEAGPTALLQLHHAVASALLAEQEDRHVEALQEIDRGFEIAQGSALALGVSDMRATTERRVRQLRDCGVGLALQQSSPEAVISVLESARAIVLTPEPDLTETELRVLSQLRSLAKSIFERSFSGSTLATLTERRNQLERDLRELRRSQPTESEARGDAPDSMFESTQERTVHLFVHDDMLRAAIVNEPDQRLLIHLGSVAQIRRTLTALRLTLAAKAGSPNGPDPSALVRSLTAQLAPLLNELQENAATCVVVEPTIGHIPWPFLVEAEIALGPSERLLRRSARPLARNVDRNVVAVTGPGLEHALAEATQVAEVYQQSLVLHGDTATAEIVNRHFGTSHLVHFASHGTFRSDNPLYSSLWLEDGPLTLFDILDGDCPDVVVFSSCDVGRSAAASSLGIASLLLSRGCRSVIASTGPVNDEAAAKLMSTMHRHYAAGHSMASSLRLAQHEWMPQYPSVALFAAYGVG